MGNNSVGGPASSEQRLGVEKAGRQDSQREIRQVIESSRRVVGSRELLLLWDRYDEDKTGTLDASECLNFLADFAETLQVHITEDAARSYFASQGKDSLSKDEFLTLFSTVNEFWTGKQSDDEEEEEEESESDLSSEDPIDMDEFARLNPGPEPKTVVNQQLARVSLSDSMKLRRKTASPPTVSASQASLNVSSSSQPPRSKTSWIAPEPRVRGESFGLAIVTLEQTNFPLVKPDQERFVFVQVELPDGQSARSISRRQLTTIEWNEPFCFLLRAPKKPAASYALTLRLLLEPKYSRLGVFAPRELGNVVVELCSLFTEQLDCVPTRVAESWQSAASAGTAGKVKLQVVYRSLRCAAGSAELERDDYGFPVSSDTTTAAAFRDWAAHYHGATVREQTGRWNDYARGKWLSTSDLAPLAQRGVPLANRGFLWQRMAQADGKRVGLPGDYYARLVETPSDDRLNAVRTQIAKDVPRTFPQHPCYGADRTCGRQALSRVLYALAQHCPQVGYCQSLNFLAAFLMLFCSEEDVFFLLVAIVEDLLPNYFSTDMMAVRVDQLVLQTLVASALPAVWQQLQRVGFHLDVVTTQWFLCLFIGYLPTETVLRFLDLFFFRGSRVLFVMSLGILQLNAAALLATRGDDEAFALLRSRIPLAYDADALLDAGRSLLRPYVSQLPQLRDAYTRNLSETTRHSDFQQLCADTRFSPDELLVLHKKFTYCVVTDVPEPLYDEFSPNRRDATVRLRLSAGSSAPSLQSNAATASFSLSSSSSRMSAVLHRSLGRTSSSPALDDTLDFENIAAEREQQLDPDSLQFQVRNAPKVLRGLDCTRFCALLGGMLKAPLDVLDKMFIISTTEGGCSFKQFARLMDVLCRGSPDEKVALFFRIFDKGQKGRLDKSDCLTFLSFLDELSTKSGVRDIAIAELYPVLLTATAAADDSGIALAQFNQALTAEPRLEVAYNLLLCLMTATIDFTFKEDPANELLQWQWTHVDP